MIRFLLDFQTIDIIVITDDSIQKTDFFYVADFLEIEKDGPTKYKLSIKETFSELLLYWKALVQENSTEVFLLYDLSDQYVSAFHLETSYFKGQDYLTITQKYTQELTGWSVTKNTSLPELKSKKWEIDTNFSVQISRAAVLRGIDWSLENLRINTNPVNL